MVRGPRAGVPRLPAARREPWLLDLARKLRAQGIDFQALFATDDMAAPTPRRGLWKWTKHVVNTAMATKAAALSWRLDQRPADRTFARDMIAFLDRHHGQVTGMFTGDECLAGKNPLQGTELCAVVEFMYSLEHLFSVFGDPFFGDRLERVAFNALPATFAPDMWSHQYDQQVNQVQCTHQPRPQLDHERPGVEPVRPRAELRLLHGEHAPGMAEVRRAPLDGVARRRTGGGRVGAVPRGGDRPGRSGPRRCRHRLPVQGHHQRSP